MEVAMVFNERTFSFAGSQYSITRTQSIIHLSRKLLAPPRPTLVLVESPWATEQGANRTGISSTRDSETPKGGIWENFVWVNTLGCKSSFIFGSVTVTSSEANVKGMSSLWVFSNFWHSWVSYISISSCLKWWLWEWAKSSVNGKVLYIPCQGHRCWTCAVYSQRFRSICGLHPLETSSTPTKPWQPNCPQTLPKVPRGRRDRTTPSWEPLFQIRVYLQLIH